LLFWIKIQNAEVVLDKFVKVCEEKMIRFVKVEVIVKHKKTLDKSKIKT